jgi:hypothetical protein
LISHLYACPYSPTLSTNNYIAAASVETSEKQVFFLQARIPKPAFDPSSVRADTAEFMLPAADIWREKIAFFLPYIGFLSIG